jgi:hypothetical protein
VALVLFITFPAGLFNQTFAENYADISAWGEKWASVLWPAGARRRLRALAHGQERPAEERPASFVAVVALGALLGALLDPDFGPNLRTLTSYVAIALSTLAGVAASSLVTTGYHRARGHGKVEAKLEALPLGLLVAAACVVVSRGIGFLPGYLYGVVAGVKFNRELAKHEEGHLVVLGSSVTITLALLAWVGWDVLNPVASKPGAFFGSVIADDFLSALFVGGLVGTVISLLPLRFLPGHKLQLWHKGAWAAMFGVALFLLLDAIMRPDSHVAGHSHAPLITAAALFVAFGGGSLLFRQHFARKHKEDDDAPDGEVGLGEEKPATVGPAPEQAV